MAQPDSSALRVAYTLEQCWHRVPGGTAVAALRVAEELVGRRDLELIGVAGRHRLPPPAAFTPPVPVRALPLSAPWLYQSWLRARWPKVEAATGPVDVVHATGLIPAACAAPLVVSVHDLAWRAHPEHFTANGVRVFERSLSVIRERAALVLVSSLETLADCVSAGIPPDRLRHVPLGVAVVPAPEGAAAGVQAKYGLPAEYLLFVGTVEPRKNLARLVQAVARLPQPLPLVVAGAPGWGRAGVGPVENTLHGVDVRFLGFVPEADLAALYDGALAFCYPSVKEGYGLPVLEAMAHGTPVVTSRGTSTEEVANGAAVLVDPLDVDDIAAGLGEALDRREDLTSLGRVVALHATWARTAELTFAAYRAVAR